MLFCPACHYIMSLVKTLEGKTEIGHVACDHCGYSEPLGNKKRLVIYESKVTSTSVLDVEAAKEDRLFQFKRTKPCSNCKDDENIVWRDNDFNVKYICAGCGALKN